MIEQGDYHQWSRHSASWDRRVHRDLCGTCNPARASSQVRPYEYECAGCAHVSKLREKREKPRATEQARNEIGIRRASACSNKELLGECDGVIAVL